MGDALVIIPTYNERDNLPAILPQVLEQDSRLEVLVVDDGSPDGTGALADGIAAREPRVHVVHREGKLGLGTAYIAGFHWAIDRGYDLVFEMDADWSHHPRHLPDMIRALEGGADVVLGSRRVPGGEDVGRSAFRVALTAASNLYVRLLLGLPVRDCNSGYRGFRRASLEAIDVRAAFSPGPAIVHELLYKARLKRLTMVEVPIRFQDRERGTSTLTFRTLLRSYVTILRLKWLALTGRIWTATA